MEHLYPGTFVNRYPRDIKKLALYHTMCIWINWSNQRLNSSNVSPGQLCYTRNFINIYYQNRKLYSFLFTVKNEFLFCLLQPVHQLLSREHLFLLLTHVRRDFIADFDITRLLDFAVLPLAVGNILRNHRANHLRRWVRVYLININNNQIFYFLIMLTRRSNTWKNT